MTPSSARPRRTSASTRQRARRKTKAPGSSKLSGVSCGWSRVLPRYVEEFRSHTLNNSNCLGPGVQPAFRGCLLSRLLLFCAASFAPEGPLPQGRTLRAHAPQQCVAGRDSGGWREWRARIILHDIKNRARLSPRPAGTAFGETGFSFLP